jgi:hypothetical protein
MKSSITGLTEQRVDMTILDVDQGTEVLMKCYSLDSANVSSTEVP